MNRLSDQILPFCSDLHAARCPRAPAPSFTAGVPIYRYLRTLTKPAPFQNLPEFSSFPSKTFREPFPLEVIATANSALDDTRKTTAAKHSSLQKNTFKSARPAHLTSTKKPVIPPVPGNSTSRRLTSNSRKYLISPFFTSAELVPLPFRVDSCEFVVPRRSLPVHVAYTLLPIYFFAPTLTR